MSFIWNCAAGGTQFISEKPATGRLTLADQFLFAAIRAISRYSDGVFPQMRRKVLEK